MKKTLTIHTTKDGNDEHWFSRSGEYGRKEIDSIVDPEGGDTKEPPTSIPSPFARFDLVRTAFATLAQDSSLSGVPNDEKLVSYSLDVGEIFFNYERLKNNLKVIRWDKNVGLKNLIDSPLKEHNRFGDALQLFIRQDGGIAKIDDDDRRSGGYNFDYMDAIYILKYKDEIIGGTSPSTLFFSAPENFNFDRFKFGDHTVFGSQYKPLHKRDVDFQKSLYALLRQKNFSRHFPEFSTYLKRGLDLLKIHNKTTWDEIGDDGAYLTDDTAQNLYEDLTTDESLLIEPIQGFRLKKGIVGVRSLAGSEFILYSEKFKKLYPEVPMPMILQDKYQGNLKYTKTNWDKNEKVPSKVETSWNGGERMLPGQIVKYPWLTVSDFLEPYIIRLIYPINSDKFYDSGFKDSNKTKDYLLPLKKDFFDFFNVEDLISGNGQKVKIELKSIAGSAVKVKLSIHLKQSEPPIVFERTYKDSINDIAQIPNELNRDGGSIKELQFGVNIMPFIRITDSSFTPDYRIQLADRDIKELTYSNEYTLKFFDSNNNQIDAPDPKERSYKALNDPLSVGTKYYNVKKNFDYISVSVGEVQGIIIPRFDKVSPVAGSETFTFAVDFGTTNTHVEYKTESNPVISPFELEADDNTIVSLHDPRFIEKDRTINNTVAMILYKIISYEWLPDSINKSSEYSFPIRTALLENSPNWSENLHGFLDYNPAFLYERKNLPGYTAATNLKWSNFTDKKQEKRVTGFIQSIMLMIRNKVILNKGSLEKTQLLWFYPLSMSEVRRNRFEEIWKKSFEELITTRTVPQRIAESTAPYYWYAYGDSKNKEVSSVHLPAINIDIGGGTTDVVAFEQDAPICVSSFRFAADSIFGDAFAKQGGASRNGFVKYYESEITEILNGCKFEDLLRAYDDIRKKQRSEDIIAFYFALRDNLEVRKKTSLDFNGMLIDNEPFKVIFLLFFAAINYHIAKLLKVKNIANPRYITFSGNGSKVLPILSNNTKVLEQFSQLIFQKIYEESYSNHGLEIVIDKENPKEVTCRGGIEYSKRINFNSRTPDQNVENILEKKSILKGTTDGKIIGRADTYQTIAEEDFESVAAEISNFISLLDEVNYSFPFKDKFGVSTSSLHECKEILSRDLIQNIKIGFEFMKEDSDENDQIGETLFFYPIIKCINTLANEIASKVSR
jgi:hypothetical protein